ncbi:MAG: hypothetical protein JKY95_05195 [Planctomycetaceae bacterium]|nr:hypothetical protein [Planctomycetaceae bacterium]
MLPTICSVAGIPLPKRTLDGIDLIPLFDGVMKNRSTPICFWNYDFKRETQSNLKNYIDPELQKGTTPLVKLSRGIPTRNFKNFHHLEISAKDYSGSRAIVDNQFKLVIHPGGKNERRELFDLRNDPAEKKNLFESRPQIAKQLGDNLHQWQQSVLRSLTEEDY